MTLEDFMKENGLTDAQVAELVKRDRSNVTRWRRKQTRPDFEALLVLERISFGRITAKSFEAVGSAS